MLWNTYPFILPNVPIGHLGTGLNNSIYCFESIIWSGDLV